MIKKGTHKKHQIVFLLVLSLCFQGSQTSFAAEKHADPLGNFQPVVSLSSAEGAVHHHDSQCGHLVGDLHEAFLLNGLTPALPISAPTLTPLQEAVAAAKAAPAALVPQNDGVPVSASDLPAEASFITKVADGHFEADFDAYMKQVLVELFPQNLVDKYDEDLLMLVELPGIKTRIREALASLYDFIVYLPTQNARFETTFYENVVRNLGILGLGNADKDDIDGIGASTGDPDLDNLNADFGPLFQDVFSDFMLGVNGRSIQQGSTILDLAEILSQNNGFDLGSFDENVLVHELAHRWGVYLSSQGQSDNNPLGILGRDGAHWSPFFNSESSPMDGFGWEDLGNGSFKLKKVVGIDLENPTIIDGRPGFDHAYNDFELYAMGLLAPENVASSFVIDNPVLASNGEALTEEKIFELLADPNFVANPIIQGTRRNITIQDVVNLEGPRSPAPATAQKDFTIAFVTIKTGDETAASLAFHRDRVTDLRNAMSAIWSKVTRNLSTMAVGPAAGAFDIFRTNVLTTFDDFITSVQGTDELESKRDDEVTRANNNKTKTDTHLSNLDDLQQAISDKKDEIGLGRVPGIQALQDRLNDLLDQVNGHKDALVQGVDGSGNPETLASAGRADLLTRVNQAATSGILPVGFGAVTDTAIDNVRQSYVNVTQTLDIASDSFEGEDTGITNAINALLSDIDSFSVLIPSIQALNLNTDHHTTYTVAPTFDAEGSNEIENRTPGFVTLTKENPSNVEFVYDLRHSSTAMTRVGVHFSSPQVLGNLPIFAAKGPAGTKMRAEFLDENGEKTFALLEMENEFKNFEVPLVGQHVSLDFDFSKIIQVNFWLDRGLVGDALRDRVELQFGELPFVLGSPFDASNHFSLPEQVVVRTAGSNEVEGRVPGFIRLDREDPSNFRFTYDLRHSSTAQTDAFLDFGDQPTVLPETFVFGMEGPEGALVKVIFEDSAGVLTTGTLKLGDGFFNYSFNLADANTTEGFNRSSVQKVHFMMERSTFGSTALRDVVNVVFGADGLIRGVPFDASALSNLPGDTLLSIRGDNAVNGRVPGFGTLRTFNPADSSFVYDLRHSSTAQVKTRFHFSEQGESLGDSLSLALKGPQDARMAIQLTDANNAVAEFEVLLTSNLLNYELDLAGPQVPNGFLLTQITDMQFFLNRELVGPGNFRDEIFFQLKKLPVVSGDDFNAGDHTPLNGNPSVSVEGGNKINGRVPGFATLTGQGADFFRLNYELRHSSTSFVKATATFKGDRGQLPENFELGARGPNGSQLKVSLLDGGGKRVDFLLVLTGQNQNYGLDLSAANVPTGFNRSDITSIEFYLDRSLVNPLHYRDTLEIFTSGLEVV